MNTLIFVLGRPASGKTTIARRIADHFSIPLFSKDIHFKEPMFDTLGYEDRQWSSKLGKAAFANMSKVVEELLRAQKSLVIESVFKPLLDTPYFQDLQQKYGFETIQIILQTEASVLEKRFADRANSGERHPGHIDQFTDYQKEFTALVAPLELDGTIITLDTTDFQQISFDNLLQEIAQKTKNL